MSPSHSVIRYRWREIPRETKSGIFAVIFLIAFTIFIFSPLAPLLGEIPKPQGYLANNQLIMQLSDNVPGDHAALLELKIDGVVVDLEKIQRTGDCLPDNITANCTLRIDIPTQPTSLIGTLLLREGPMESVLQITINDQHAKIINLNGPMDGTRLVQLLLPVREKVSYQPLLQLMGWLVMHLFLILLLAGILFLLVFWLLPPPWIKMASEKLLPFVLLMAMAGVYVFLISAGKNSAWPDFRSYYALQADSFLQGQTALQLKPDPGLLALANPYDRDLNKNFREHDLSLYNGQYFLYWGPVPALFLAPLRVVGSFSDQHLVFIFLIGTYILSYLLLLKIRSICFPLTPSWFVLWPALGMGLGTPVAAILGRPAVYEAALTVGQFCMNACILLIIMAFSSSRVRPVLWISIGICLALAVGSRLSLAVPVAFHIAWLAATFLVFPGVRGKRGRWIYTILLVTAPVICMVAALMVFNAVRFGSILETGWAYQLNSDEIRVVFSGWYVLPNLFSYFLRPVGLLNQFPFIHPLDGYAANAFPAWLIPPVSYARIEQFTGLLWTTPFILFIIPSLFFGIAFLIVVFFQYRSKKLQINETPPRWMKPWISAYLAGSTLVPLGLLLVFYGSASRYQTDFITPACLLSAIGIWELNKRIRNIPPARILLALLVPLLTIWGIAANLTLAAAGPLRSNNPSLYSSIAGWGNYLYFLLLSLVS